MTGAPGRILGAIVRASTRRPLGTVAVSLVLAAVSLAYTVTSIGFITSNVRLLPQHQRYVVLLRDYLKDFGELNDIIVVVEAPEPEAAKRYAASLTETLRRRGLGDRRITFRVDPDFFARRGLLYLSVDDLVKLRDRVYDYQEFIEDYAARPTLVQLLEGLNRQIANAMAVGFLDLGLGSKGSEDLRFLEAVLAQITRSLEGRPGYASPWTTAFSLGRLDEPDAGYYFSSDKNLLFMFVEQRRREGDFGENRGKIRLIREAIQQLAPEHPGVQAGVTGGPALANDEMGTALSDSTVATALAFAVTLLLLLVALRRVAKSVLMLFTLGVSLAWSLGLITLVLGHLSVFSVMFISIVVGIGIDYGIYFLYRYEEERALGAAVARALGRTAAAAGPGMLLGALTAAGTFFVLMLTDFQGIREFGFVAGSALLMAFVSMVTLLPAFVVVLDRRWSARDPAPVARLDDRLRARWIERAIARPWLVLAVAAAITAVALWGILSVRFDYNMLKLQARGVESVRWEQRILTAAGRSGFAALATATSLEDLARKQDGFQKLPTVSKVESVLMLVPDRQPDKIKLIADFAPLLEPVRVRTPASIAAAELRAPLVTLRRRLGLAVDAGAEDGKDVGEMRAARDQVDAVLRHLRERDPAAATAALEGLQRELYRDFADKLRSFQQNLRPLPVRPGDAPPELRQRFVGDSGRYLLRIHPAVDIWEQEGAARFVQGLRSVDPDVTGPPVTSFEAIGYIRRGYFEGTLYALGLVALVTLGLLRSLRGTALALSPLVLGVLWTVGLMDWLGLSFNLANVWALPLIIGTAAEYGLNIYVRYLEGRDSGGPLLARSTVSAVVLNGLTTIGGFGTLLVARHQGIFGLGLLLCVGATASLVASLLVLPALLRLVEGRATDGATGAR